MINAEGNCSNCHCCDRELGYVREGDPQKHTIRIEIGLKNKEGETQ
jgi:hypothetical protein